MRIVSQKRNRSINFEFYDICLMGKDIFAMRAGDNTIHSVIGSYQTEKRAQEVFDWIQEMYENESRRVIHMPGK